MPRRTTALLAATGLIVSGGCGAGDVQRPEARTQTITVATPGGGSASAASDGDSEAARASERRCPGATERPDSGNAQRIAAATLCLVNHERTKRDRPALEDDSRLARGAARKASDMVERRYFEHEGPRGRNVRDWVRPTGYLPDSGGYQLGENIAWAPGGAATPHAIVEGWMNSPTHRRNILDGDFEHSGIGVAFGVPVEGKEPGATYAHFFGSHDPPG